jgi:hypothetical protein
MESSASALSKNVYRPDNTVSVFPRRSRTRSTNVARTDSPTIKLPVTTATVIIAATAINR